VENKAAAINSLEEEISKFIELDFHKNSDWTSWDKLYRTISDWSRNDIELKNAFADVVKR
jgi:sensor domain CHASE-containing protein